MSINLISLAQILLISIIGAFFGNLFYIFIDRKFFSKQSEILNQLKPLEMILSSFKMSLYIGVAAFSLACIDTLLAFNSINLRFIANDNFANAFGWAFFATMIGTLEKAFKTISVSKENK